MPNLDTFGSACDYFTILPSQPASCSPLTTPEDDAFFPLGHPRLAFRPLNHPPHLSPAMASNFMSLQTSAAHAQSPTRPRPVPMQQNVLWTSSNDARSSSDSSSTSSADNTSNLPVTARCSRCQRTPSVDIQTGRSNMISYGLNLWYCSRCAALVGFKR
ncbi:hypothetical protein CERZMDRAFT_90899 [Cercospora zeae-maydis SCOH1-5]|uniref:Uncharacterized protein n=1 Tax=Cercospora zeae-maydis SCOH1-5 TaxID=717836 RepID=A0A6A6FDF7_9PEZI|nr:hypothetical protein CERZMDRAFT_90899 [Cercospora zeae-maydis SCOH1-5]